MESKGPGVFKQTDCNPPANRQNAVSSDEKPAKIR